VRRDILGGMHEDIDITNHHLERVEFQMLAIRSDFADIFQVKSKQLARGQIETTWKDGCCEYRNGAFHRGIIAAPDHYAATLRQWSSLLDIADPAETWHACINFIALVDGEVLEPKHTSAATDVQLEK